MSLKKDTPVVLDESSADNDQVVTDENDNANQISPAKIFSSPLLKRLYVTSDFGEQYNLHNETFHQI